MTLGTYEKCDTYGTYVGDLGDMGDLGEKEKGRF